MNNFTFFDFKKLTEDEQALNKLLNTTPLKWNKMPSKQAVNNVLAYSKALSIRSSENLGFLENVLN